MIEDVWNAQRKRSEGKRSNRAGEKVRGGERGRVKRARGGERSGKREEEER